MAAIYNLILLFLILVCALHIELIRFISNHHEIQEKQYQLLVNITNVLQTRLPLPQDCSPALSTGQNRILPSNAAFGSFNVYCDMDTGLGGWILFQRRFDGSVDFDRNWVEYEDGFGTLEGEFWLGLKKLYILTSHNKWELRVDLEDFEGNHAYALYNNFKISDSSSLYRVNLGSYSGTAGNSMTDFEGDLNGMTFTTKDQDHDKWSSGNCGVDHHSGWWHRRCTFANLNGLYLGQNGDNLTGIVWYGLKQWQSLKKSEMKIRPVESSTHSKPSSGHLRFN